MLICEPKCKCWEDCPNVTPDLEVLQTKEIYTKFPFCECHLSKGSSDSQLSGPCRVIEPEHPLALLIFQPIFEFYIRKSPAHF